MSPNRFISFCFFIVLFLGSIAPALANGEVMDGDAAEPDRQTVENEFREAHQQFFRLLTGEGKDIEVRHLIVPKAESTSGNGRLALEQETVSAELPIPISRDFFLRFSPEYDARFYKFSNVEILGQRPGRVTYHRAVVGVGAGYFANDNLFLTGKFDPALMSDLDGPIDHEDVQYFGQGLVVYQFSELAQIVAGVLSDDLFQGTEVYPVAALRLRSADRRWHLKLTPPVDARLGYMVNSKDQVYLRFWQTGDEFRTFFEDVPAEFDVRIEDRRVGVGLLHWIDQHLNFSVEVGAAIASQFDFQVNLPDLPDEDTDPTVYSFFSIGYAL